MIAFFPAFYPDELVFSACSRYHERMNYRSSYCTARDLFGVSTARTSVDLPSRLHDLSKVLPFGHSYTADRLLTQHTLFPVYAAFESPKRASEMRKAMAGRRPVHAISGSLTLKLRCQFLRYCIECVVVDRATWGETYWHRIHNIPGVVVCPTHNAFLIDSPLPIGRGSCREGFVTAEKVISAKARPPKKIYHKEYSVLALEHRWLLKQGPLSCDRASKFNRIVRLLYDRGFATFWGKIRRRKLEDALRAFYSSDLLRTLQSEVYRSTWVPAITQPRHKSGQPPYRHILILHLLDCSLEQFFSLTDEPFKPFGSPPWPCLNRAADHFNQSIIVDCHVRMATDGTSRPLGSFRCECGFVYSRLGPDKTANDRLRYHRITAYGPALRGTLKELCKTARSRKEVALELGLSLRTVEYVLTRGGAPKTRTRKVSPILLNERRALWSAAVKKNPNLSRNKIRAIVGNVVYNMLRRCDREWLNQNAPPRVKPSGPPPLIDWPKRDQELALQIPIAAAQIKESPGRPIRASMTLIARKLGALEVIYKRPHCLPVTRVAILAAAETVLDFAIRRLRWAAESYKTEGKKFTIWKLKLRAGVSRSMAENPNVAVVIESLVSEYNCRNAEEITETIQSM